MTQKQIHFHQTTTLTPEQYIAGLTDFGRLSESALSRPHGGRCH
jgi:hypothetical protein